MALSFLAAQAGELDEADRAAAAGPAARPDSAEAMNVSGVVALKRQANGRRPSGGSGPGWPSTRRARTC